MFHLHKIRNAKKKKVRGDMQPGTKGRCFYFDADRNVEPVSFLLFFLTALQSYMAKLGTERGEAFTQTTIQNYFLL